MDALQIANDIRMRRAQLKRDLRAGRCRAIDVIADPPEYAMTMKLVVVLLATPRIAEVKAYRVLRLTDTSPSKTLGGLSPRQRAAVIGALSGAGWRR
jgi:hypothetical protein